jgi:hypothetical protein
MARKQRESYHGPVAIWVDGVKRFDVEAELTSYVEVAEVDALGDAQQVDDALSWDGRLEGLSQHNRLELIAQQLELRLPDEQIGSAVMPDNSGAIRGTGNPPFGRDDQR